MRRVLLIYPRFPETFWGYQRALRLLGIPATHPPLGLLTVAGLLPSDCEVKLVDLNVRALRPEELRWADVVLTGGMMIQRHSVEWIAQECKTVGVPLIIGGPDATSSPQDLPSWAHLVRGEAESPRFTNSLGEMARASGRIVLDLRDEPQGIDDAPLPRYDLINMKKYASMALQMSRGCPFKCEFCDIPTLFGKQTRYKSIDRTLAELDLLYARGWRGSVFWVDDNFIGNKKSCKEILPEVLEWQESKGRPFQFYTQASVNLAGDDKLLDLMVRTGFNSVFLGIETPIEESLRETRKLQNIRFDLTESVSTIQRAGMEVMGGFIIGFDNDPIDIDRHLVRFIEKSGIPVAMTGLLTAIPGSPLYERFKQEGRLLSADAEEQGDNTFQFRFNFKTRQKADDLIRAYKKVLRETYGRPERYFGRVDTLLRNLSRHPLSREQISWRRVRAFVHSLFMIPASRYGWSYGKFLLRALARYPHRFQEAARYGIVGVHFHRLTRDRLATHEFSNFVHQAVERVQSAYANGRREGLERAEEVLSDARRLLRRLPSTARREVVGLYEELERNLSGLAAAWEMA